MKKVSCLVVLISLVLINFTFAKSKPDWVDNVDKDCSKEEICATGSGDSSRMAKTDARNNILKYFETSVSSKFQSSLSSDEVNVSSFKSEDLEEVSDGILKGVKIKSTYNNDREFYAFAVLNKGIATKEIKSDIEKADTRMKLLIAENNVRYNKQLESLYIKRDELNKRYLILTGNMIPEVVKYEEIFKAKKRSGELSLNYYIAPAEGYEQQVNDYLASVLLDNGAKVSNNETKANRFVMVTVNKTKMHLGINGFVKEMYILKIETTNSSAEVISSLYQEFTDTGRSDSQIQEIVNMRIKNYINENIEDILQ